MKVALLQVPSGDPTVASGGSQVVALALARQLAALGVDAILFCGFRPGARPAPSEQDPPIVGAFALTPECLTRGVPAIEFEKNALALLAECAAAFMFDRVFPVPPGVPRVLVLGTAGYSFAAEAAGSGSWDRLIVPSDFMRTQLAQLLGQAGVPDRLADVVLVPNPVRTWPRTASNSPASTSDRPLRLLFPHRADAKKGPHEAVHLLAGLQAARRSATLDVVVDTSETAEGGFYERLLEEARRLGVAKHVRLVPWRPHEEMHYLYSDADVTVCLGSLPEGFGLVVLESLGCGTPVVTRALGAESELLPEPSGRFMCSVPLTRMDTARLVRLLDDGTLYRAARAAATRIQHLHGDRQIAMSYLAAAGVSEVAPSPRSVTSDFDLSDAVPVRGACVDTETGRQEIS